MSSQSVTRLQTSSIADSQKKINKRGFFSSYVRHLAVVCVTETKFVSRCEAIVRFSVAEMRQIVLLLLSLLVKTNFISVDGLEQKIASDLHPRLNELDEIDEFDSIVGSVKLGPNEFDRQLNTSQYHMVLFYVPWCVTN